MSALVISGHTDKSAEGVETPLHDWGLVHAALAKPPPDHEGKRQNLPLLQSSLMKIEYYGEVLVGCNECNRWAGLAIRRSSCNCWKTILRRSGPSAARRRGN